MPTPRDPMKSRALRLQVSVTPETMRRLLRLAKREKLPSAAGIAHRLLVAALDREEAA